MRRRRNNNVYEGYRLNGYNATFEKTSIEERIRHEDDSEQVIEVTDLNSGITLIYIKKKYGPTQ